MKKIILSILSFFVFYSANAQDTISCSATYVDTVKYINSLTSNYLGTGINISNSGGTAGYAGYAQLFEAPDTITLKGFCFYSVIEGALPDVVDAALYLPDGAGGSPGTLIESVSVGVSNFASYTGAMNASVIKRCASFASPREIEGDYFLSVRNLTDVNVFLTRNADGNALGTPSEFVYYHEDAGTFSGWYDLGTFGAGWQFNAVIEPIISYDFEVTTIANDSVFCVGDTITLDLRVAEGDSAFYNKHYNPNFSTYNGLLSSKVINYGDGAGNTVDTSHVYTAGGNYTIARNFNIVTPVWTQNSMIISCDGTVRVVDPMIDLGVDINVCAGTLVTIEAGLNSDSYLWSNTSTSNAISIDTDTMANGAYTFYVDVQKEFCTSSDTITVNVGDLSIDLGSDTTLCLNQDVTLTAGSFDSYLWNSGQTTETISVGPFANAGVQTYILTVLDGSCEGKDTLVLTVDNCLGVSNQDEVVFDVYPNPNNGQFKIDLSEIDIKGGVISIFDNQGREVFKQNIANSFEDVHAKSLVNGSYFVSITWGEKQIVKKIEIIN